METKKELLGKKIKRFRLVNDIRQEDMADKMGVSRATLINYEKGYTTVNIDALDRLKEAYPLFKEDESENHKPKIIENNIIDFRLLFKVLASNIKYISFTTIFVGLLGILFSFSFSKSYTAQISLYPAKKDSMQGLGQLQSIAANFGVNTAQKSNNFNIPDVVRSRLIANKVLKNSWQSQNKEKINLIQMWGLYKKPWYRLSKKFEIDSSSVFSKALNRFNNHIYVSEDQITGLIRIDTKFSDPVISAEIANFIGDNVQTYIQKENSAQSKKEKLFISDRLSIVRNELELAELELKKFKERNRGYESSPELFMVFSRLFRESEAKKEVYMTLQQQLELARIDEVKQSPILHILDHAVPPIEKSSPNRIMFLIIFLILGASYSSLKTLFKY